MVSNTSDNEGCLLACVSFVSASTPHNKCGSDGLPLTPNSTKALGFGLELCGLRHRNLCPYIDFRCGRDGRVFGVAQYHDTSLDNLINRGRPNSFTNDQWARQCINLARAMFSGLHYLNTVSLTHQGLQPSKVLISRPTATPKLFNFGLHHVTDSTRLVDFPLAVCKYAAPETILSEFLGGDGELMMKADVWAACLMTLELYHGRRLELGRTNCEIFENILKLTLLDDPKQVLDKILGYLGIEEGWQGDGSADDDHLYRVLLRGLDVDVCRRLDAGGMLKLDALQSDQPSTLHPCLLNNNKLYQDDDDSMNGMDDIDCKQAWHLWNLAGGDLPSLYTSQTKTPPIQRLPCYVTKEGANLGQGSSPPESLYDPQAKVLSLDTLRKRMRIEYDNVNAILPLLDKNFERTMMTDIAKLPLVIRENDFDYQVYRMSLCKHVLGSYPHVKEALWRTTKIDIPPAYRGELWSKLLDVSAGWNLKQRYEEIDKSTPTITDRQLSVDIPRCHSYNKIMSSPAAHAKLKRVLKAWLNSHPDLYYWQGLDSLCAVFVYWNFDNEPRAYQSLTNFIDKYMYGLFRKYNSDVLQEYLQVFTLLLGFHDPELSLHMLNIEFGANLFAITWFLTMFAHVFPLHTIVHLWDTLLLGNSSFPLLVGVAILSQLRDHLLHADFNECILFFSELPQLDIDAVMRKSISLFCQTPKSATMRRHQRDLQGEEHRRTREALPSVDELRKLHCCQISGEDLIELCHLKTPAPRSGSASLSIHVIDVRPRDEFKRGAVPNSINHDATDAGAGAKSSSSAVAGYESAKKKKASLVVVVGRSGCADDDRYGKLLLEQGVTRVCVLRGGIDVLKPLGVLTVPSSQ